MKKTYRLEDLDCANCAAKIEKDTAKLEGVKSAALNLLSQKMVIECDENAVDDITKTIVKIVKKYEPDVVVSEI